MPGTRAGAESLSILDRKLLFVTGKGGVGKSTIAASIALLNSQRGKRTLVCEVDAKGQLADIFESQPIAYKSSEISPDLWAMSMDTEEALREYLKLILRLPLVLRLGPLAKTFEFVANAAPGVKEILVMGKLCWEVREANWDLVVVDATATGHIVGHLAAPQAINDLVKVGLVRQQTNWMLDIITNPAQTGLVVVTTPEEMPVNETIELVESLGTQTEIALAAVIVNRVLPELFGRGEEEVFGELSSPQGIAALEQACGGDPRNIVEGAKLAVTLRRSGAAHLKRLRESIDPAVEMMYLPYLFTRSYGMRSVRGIAEAIDAELGDGPLQ